MNRIGIKDRIAWNVTGQTLAFECPTGRPSADGTVTLYDCRYDPDDTAHNPIVTGTASRVAIDTTMNGAAGPDESDPRSIPILAANITAIAALLQRGDWLWLENASKQREQIQVEKIGTSSIGARDKLAYTYASGAKVQSARLASPAIPTAWIQDEDNLGAEDCWALWVVTVDGASFRLRSYFDVVLDTSAPGATVAEPDVIDEFPALAETMSQAEFEGLRRAAQRDVDLVLRMRYLKPQLIRGNEYVQALVRKRLMLLAAEAGHRPGNIDQASFLQRRQDEWVQLEQRFLAGMMPIPYDETEDDTFDKERDGNVPQLVI